MGIIDRLRGVLPADRFRAALQGVYAPVYEDAVWVSLLMGDASRALEAAERARARSLLDLLEGGAQVAERDDRALAAEADGDASDDPEARLLTELRRWRGELNALYSRIGLGSRESAAAARTRSQRAREVGDEIARVESRLASSRRYAEAYRDPPGADQIREALSPGSALVEYAVARGELVAIVARRGCPVQAARLGPVSRVGRLLERWSLQVGRARARGMEEARSPRLREAAIVELRSLYDALLAPLADALAGADRVIASPCAELLACPFHALHDGRGHLVERLEVSLTPSAALLAMRAEGRAGAGALLVGVADDDAPDIDREIEDLGALIPDARRLTGGEATVGGLRSSACGVSVLHLASHATHTPGSAMSARLRLADRWLTARDLYSLRLDGAVVVLTGCETARAEGGDEQLGLVRGFLGAGARAVIASLWPVHDQSARRFVATVYARALAAGSPAPTRAALTFGAREWIDNGEHPAAWAPLVWFGRGENA